MFLEETPAVLSLGKLCEDHGKTYHWTSGQKPHLTKKGKRIDCNISNYVPSVVPGLSTSSSPTPTPTSLSSSLQDSVLDESRYTENPVPERSGSTSEELRRNLRLWIETLPVLLMNYQWSREQKWNRVRVSMVSTRNFRRTQIAISA